MTASEDPGQDELDRIAYVNAGDKWLSDFDSLRREVYLLKDIPMEDGFSHIKVHQVAELIDSRNTLANLLNHLDPPREDPK